MERIGMISYVLQILFFKGPSVEGQSWSKEIGLYLYSSGNNVNLNWSNDTGAEIGEEVRKRCHVLPK